MMAISKALSHFAPVLINQSVLILSDNTTVVSYLRRQGGTRSPWAPFTMGTQTWDKTPFSLHSGKVERSSRRSFQTESNFEYGMISSSHDNRSSFSEMVTTSHRPIRNSVESQAPNVCLSLSGFSSMGSRRDNFELERSVRLCVSPVCSSSKGIGKGEVGKVQDPTSSTLVAEPSLDSSVVGSSLRFSKSSTDWTDNAQAASHERFSQQSHDLQPSRLALVQDRLRDESFSGTSAKRIAGAKRRSTSRVYDAKWHIFTQWCQQENIVPTKISIQRLADFFNFLFDVKSLRPSTISGYRSSISNTLKHFGRNDISTHVAFDQMLSTTPFTENKHK
ncbi:hypothetical protein SNE40_021104 [Patella caerulea]|uniref:Core-binding (CB) domain-containing protein n=1 Tax=Patella caerulea TaxID=87958 RepID=A0AAN8GD95_PATCE